MEKTTSLGKVIVDVIWKFKFWLDLVKEEVERRLSEGNVNVIIF
jgi:hypothetical protein